jgi:hypothetical protein
MMAEMRAFDQGRGGELMKGERCDMEDEKGGRSSNEGKRNNE